jgi:hypothetical protein
MKRVIHKAKGTGKEKKEPGESLGEKLARLFEIPADVYGNRPKVTAIGRGEVLIENFK